MNRLGKLIIVSIIGPCAQPCGAGLLRGARHDLESTFAERKTHLGRDASGKSNNSSHHIPKSFEGAKPAP